MKSSHLKKIDLESAINLSCSFYGEVHIRIPILSSDVIENEFFVLILNDGFVNLTTYCTPFLKWPNIPAGHKPVVRSLSML